MDAPTLPSFQFMRADRIRLQPYSLGHVVDALGNDKSKFSEQPADLIGLRGTRLYKTLAHPMHR
jgi:hypothetical protein